MPSAGRDYTLIFARSGPYVAAGLSQASNAGVPTRLPITAIPLRRQRRPPLATARSPSPGATGHKLNHFGHLALEQWRPLTVLYTHDGQLGRSMPTSALEHARRPVRYAVSVR